MSYHDSIVVVIVAGKGVPQRLYYLFIGNKTWITLDYNNNDIYIEFFKAIKLRDTIKRYIKCVSLIYVLFMFQI